MTDIDELLRKHRQEVLKQKDEPIRVVIQQPAYPEWIKWFWIISIGFSILIMFFSMINWSMYP